MDVLKTRTDLADYFRSKAQWRLDVAKERCRDGSWSTLKNELYAERLEEVAKHVESLSDDDPVLIQAAALGLDPFAADSLHTHTIHCDFREIGIDRWLRTWIADAHCVLPWLG